MCLSGRRDCPAAEFVKFKLNQATWCILSLLSRRSRQRERLSASELSICLSVCRQNAKKAIFSKKLSNLELWCLLTTHRKLCKLNWAFQRTHYWIHTIQDGWYPPCWKSTWRHFFSAEGGPIWIKFRRHVDCGDVWKWKPDVEFQYGGRLGESNGMSSHSHVSK